MAALFFGCGAALACQSYNAGYNAALTRGREATAISTLHQIARDQHAYSTSNRGEYGTFQQLVHADFLESALESDKPKVNDYVFTMRLTPKGRGYAEGLVQH